jgi:threonine/homoserine/homoserine lactone efflux protein
MVEGRVEALLALVGFSFVSSVTPGPNNLLLWTSGVEFGLRATVPHVLGTALGLGLLAMAVAAGLGVLMASVPGLEFAMKVAGSLYLIYLAYQIAGARALAAVALARPMTVLQAAGFQAINPKAWIFALGAITTFRPPDQPVVTGSVIVAIVMMIVIIPSAGIWAAGGGLIGRLAAGKGLPRVLSLALAGLLVATVAYVWI